MSFGGSGSGFGFGQPAAPTFGFGANNNNSSTGNSGFGTNNNTSSPFGAVGNSNNNANSTPSLFGSGGGTTGTAGFGGGAGSFGSNSGGLFGQQKPAFGAPATSNAPLFGGGTATTTTGSNFGSAGFSANNNNATASGFGPGGTLFGQNKPSFSTNASTSAFGSGGTTSGSFGATAANPATFGAVNNPGIGANVSDPPGTGQIPFQPTIEKEANNTNMNNAFQSILLMDSYKKWSVEELRLADYNQGRRYGNASGTGAFGVSAFSGSSAFNGGTNNTASGFSGGGTGVFGSNTNNTSGNTGYGATNNTGFGANSGSGIFGQNQPASSSLFGSNNNTQPGGGFGPGFGANYSASAFSASANNNAGSTGGLFGANTNANNKPAGFGFGTTNNASAGFGSGGTASTFATNNANTNTGGGLFGNTGQPQNNTTGGFGTNTGAAFGAQNNQSGASGLFGSNQAKPGGLFGSNNVAPASTGTGLFGGASANNTTGFGQPNNQSATGGLFGQNKPAGTTATGAAGGGGLFGNAKPATTGGIGLFGSAGANTQTEPTGNTLFGGLGQNQVKPSPFATSQNNGSSIFGAGQSMQNSGGSLFGSATSQAQLQQPGFASGSIMYNGAQNAQAANQGISTSLSDLAAYGSPSLFSVNSGEITNQGPLATPLSGNRAKNRNRSILPTFKMSPANASRLGSTPQNSALGFSYSTYGTPGSPSSAVSTPGGLGQSLLLGGSLSRSLSKSTSTSSLRRSFNTQDSILPPGAFAASAGPRLLGNANQRKLVINKDMRTDLFTPPAKEKQSRQDPPMATMTGRKLNKRVSFDTSIGAIEYRPQNDDDAPDEDGSQTPVYHRPASRPGNGMANGSKQSSRTSPAHASPSPDMIQTPSKEELHVVDEEDIPTPKVRHSKPASELEPGEYWMSPSKEEILNMNRIQRHQVPDFTVGRENVGSVRFKVPVDLTNIDLDNLFGNIVVLETRSVTVYPNKARTPPVGKGLNVPALISLEQSWPRGRDRRMSGTDKRGLRLRKHVERLQRFEETTFESYDDELGVWTFSVEHFSRYELDYEDDSDADEVVDDKQRESRKPSDVGPPSALPPVRDPDLSVSQPRPGVLPGTFEPDELAHDDNDAMGAKPSQPPSSLAHMTLLAPLPGRDTDEAAMTDAVEEMAPPAFDVADALVSEEEMELEPGEIEGTWTTYGNKGVVGLDQHAPAGIVRARMWAIKRKSMPVDICVSGGDDWAQSLMDSVRVPRTTDRARLRALNEASLGNDMEACGSPVPRERVVSDGNGFATSVDLMNSLFDHGASGSTASVPGAQSSRGFVKWPYPQQAKIIERAEGDVPPIKPHWDGHGHLITSGGPLSNVIPGGVHAVGRSSDRQIALLHQQMALTRLFAADDKGGMVAKLGPLKRLGDLGTSDMWTLVGILFDGWSDKRRSSLLAFWKEFVRAEVDVALQSTTLSTEEKALICLSGHRVAEACHFLQDGRNYRLASLVALIGSSDQIKKDIRAQLKDWRECHTLSELADPIRAIYELLSGNPCACAGTKDVAVEDRVESFVISKRFNMSWRRAFGLRLWYGTGLHDEVDAAVRLFNSDVEQGRESIASGAMAPPNDLVLWRLLYLSAFPDAASLEWVTDVGMFDNPEDYQLSWQLGQVLASMGRAAFEDETRSAQMTVSFASQLQAEGYLFEAIWVLLHLPPSLNGRLVEEFLAREAHQLSPDQSLAKRLVTDLQLRPAMLWRVRALFYRARAEPVQEFVALVAAREYREASRTFSRHVAPRLVIARRYDDLFEYASWLQAAPCAEVPDWEAEGRVYLHFVAMMKWEQAGNKGVPEAILSLPEQLRALRAKMTGANDSSSGNDDGVVAGVVVDSHILQVAALAEMATELVELGVRMWKRGDDAFFYETAKLLPLPPETAEKYQRQLYLMTQAA